MASVWIVVVALICGAVYYTNQIDTFTMLTPEEIASEAYDLKPISSPTLNGVALKLFASLIRFPLVGPFILKQIIRDNNILIVRRLSISRYLNPSIMDVVRLAGSLNEIPSYFSTKPVSDDVRSFHEQRAKGKEATIESLVKSDQEEQKTPAGFKHWTISDFTSRYSAGKLTPLQVAKAILAAVKRSDLEKTPHRAIVVTNEDDLLQQARESTKRYQEKKTIGVLDGVPVAVKDEFHVKGYPTTYGTSFINIGIDEQYDDMSVKRLRDAGAMIVGKANLHEIGIGVTGLNTHYGSARNPYNRNHYTGGSSSGSASAVASGLVPIAIGSDGGGSLRIPASMCGAVSIKATFQRIPYNCLVSPSNAHGGPIANSINDLALVYAIMSGPHALSPLSLLQPPMHLSSYELHKDLSGINIGIFSEYFDDANPEVVHVCRKALNKFKDLGASIVETKIPHLQAFHTAHGLTIATEMAQGMDKYHRHNFTSFELDTQISLAVGRSFSGVDLLAAQKVRSFGLKIMEKIFDKVDAFATPGTAITAPKITSEALHVGESNLHQMSNIMKYILIGNFFGIPGIVFPVGYDKNGLPISMQLQGRHWDEDTLFRLAKAAESFLPNGIKKPEIYYSIIDDALKF